MYQKKQTRPEISLSGCARMRGKVFIIIHTAAFDLYFGSSLTLLHRKYL